MQGWEQQDAQEFLISFMEVLNLENTENLAKGGISLAYKENTTLEENWKHFVS